MNETELVGRILSGDERLFAQIVTRYSGCVWAICSSYVRNPSECEDVAQEVFVQCYRRLHTLRNPQALGGWLGQLARSHCLMWLRASSRRARHMASYRALGNSQQTENPGMARHELQEAIWEAVDQLPAHYREALLLRYAEGYSAEETASFLEVTPAAARKRIERAQHMLRNMMWDQIEPALAGRKHGNALATRALAAIPFGTAPWLGTTGATGVAAVSASTHFALTGGTFVMLKNLALGIAALLVTAGGVYAGVKMTQPSGSATATAANTATPAGAAHAAAPAAASPGQPVPEKTPHGTNATDAPALAAAQQTPGDAVAHADCDVSAPAATPGASASVSGFVRDRDNTPINGADVFLEVGAGFDRNDVVGHYKAKAGPDGKYQIGGIDRFGPGVVYACGDGYAMAFSSVKIAPGAMLKGTDVSLEPAAWYVSGKVVDEQGAGVPGASVDCLYYAYDKTGLTHTAVTGQTTGNIGGVRLAFTATETGGRFRLAIPREGLCDFRVVKDGYGPGFFAQIPTGAEDALFVLKSAGAIAGRVSDAEGRPIPGATVRIFGEACPGGLPFSLAKIQPLLAPPVTVKTDVDGMYLAQGLGEDFTYAASVPGTDFEEVEQLSVENGLRAIASMMCEFGVSVSGVQTLARETGIHVKAGKTTAGANLIVDKSGYVTIRGRVTDRISGKPVCPIVITAVPSQPGENGAAKNFFQTDGMAAVTREDGSYALQITEIKRGTHVSIGHLYMTEGGSAWDQPEEELAALDLAPGDTRELDLTVDAPVIVPVRYVTPDGRACEGIAAAMRAAGGRGGCGGTLVSGSDGRVTFHGIRPGIKLQAVAWTRAGSQLNTAGVSEPFMGKPGQAVAELAVVCRLTGGIEGVLTYPDGRPVANVTLVCGAQNAGSAPVAASDSSTTDATGRFQFPASLPEGTYEELAVGFLEQESAVAHSATAANVEITAGGMTDLGTLVATPEKDLLRVIAAVGYDHQSNQAIAMLYAPEWIDALPDPGAHLKTAFALYDMERYEEALDVFRHLAASSDAQPIYQAIAHVWQGHMLDLLGRRPEAIGAYTIAAGMDITDIVRHDQFGLAYAPSEEANKRLTTPFQRVENKE